MQSGIAGKLAARITRRTRATDFVALIEAVAAATDGAETAEEATRACIEQVCRWAGWPVGHAYLVDGDAPLQPSGIWYVDHPTRYERFREQTAALPLPLGVGLPGRVAADGGAAWIHSLACDPNYPRAAVATEVSLRGGFAFPVPVGDSVHAVIECYSTHVVKPHQRLLEVTAHIGRQLGRRIAGLQLDAALRESENRFRSLSESANDGVVIAGGDGRIVFWNPGAERIFGYEEAEVLGEPVSVLMPEGMRGWHDRRVEKASRNGVLQSRVIGQTIELVGRRKHGGEFPLELSLSAWESDGTRQFAAIMRDISERKRVERQLQRLADVDALTDLYNRRRFDAELDAHVVGGGSGALLLLDLDRFKYINDTRGHKAGDAVIRAIGTVLRECVRKTDVVARLGGDEFAVLLREADRAAAERVAAAMLRTVCGRRLRLDGHNLTVTTSIGISCFDAGETGVEDLMVAADLAMYAAKEAGGNRFHVAQGDGGDHVSGMQLRLAWAEQIRRALENDRLVLHCQPILQLEDERITQYELLVRMIDGDGQLVEPGAFIDTAERFGLVQALDRWVVRRAIELLAAHDGVRFEVNVSGRSMGDMSLPELIERELAATGVDPGRLVFEITETAAIANMEQARVFAERLTALGCRFALDDFGAGFSSFYYLKNLPLDYLKIDGDFVRSLTSSVTDRLVVRSMVEIARGLGMRTIAEFVEDAATAELLRHKGVDYAQGYHFGAPRPVEEALSLAAAAR